MAREEDTEDAGDAAEGMLGSPGTDAEGRARDMEAELLDRRGDAEAALSDRVEELKNVDAPKEVKVPFWAAVVFTNVAVFCLAVGPMLIYFRGMTLVGAAVIGGGLLALYRTYSVYRSFEADRAAREGADGPPSVAAGDDEASDAASDER